MQEIVAPSHLGPSHSLWIKYGNHTFPSLLFLVHFPSGNEDISGTETGAPSDHHGSAFQDAFITDRRVNS